MRLAVVEGKSSWDIMPALRAVFDQRGLALPSEYQAVNLVAEGIVDELLAGRIEPYAAARRLALLARVVPMESISWEDLSPFVALEDGWSSASIGSESDEDDVREWARGMLPLLPAEVRGAAEELRRRGGVRVPSER